jgi:phospholipase/carboxylesterase
MLSRRELLVSLSAVLAASCSRSKAPIPWPRRTVHEGVPFIELFPHDADESSPIVVAIHGRGDHPERWIETWRGFPTAARIALPRAPEPLGDGFTWFDFRGGMTDEQFGAAVGAAEERLWRGVSKLAASGRRLVVTGFSQGGILSFAMAARHPDAIARAFPVAGSCPGPLLPKEGARAAPVSAFHGTEDDVLQVRWAREAVRAFQESGNVAALREYPGVRHTITNAMRADLWSAIVTELGRSPAPGR